MTEKKFIQDPWAKMTTQSGLVGDKVISALQKSICKGKEEDACEFAYEIYTTSPQFEEKLWRCLLVISVEDIGMGSPITALIISNLNMMRKEFQYNESDRAMFFFHAIRYLCGSKKDRSSGLLKNIIIKSFAMEYVPEIPDIALDKHTTRGQEIGRGSGHFLYEASKVIPQAKAENGYKEQYEEITKRYDPSHVISGMSVSNPR